MLISSKVHLICNIVSLFTNTSISYATWLSVVAIMQYVTAAHNRRTFVQKIELPVHADSLDPYVLGSSYLATVTFHGRVRIMSWGRLLVERPLIL